LVSVQLLPILAQFGAVAPQLSLIPPKVLSIVDASSMPVVGIGKAGCGHQYEQAKRSCCDHRSDTLPPFHLLPPCSGVMLHTAERQTPSVWESCESENGVRMISTFLLKSLVGLVNRHLAICSQSAYTRM